MARRSNIAASGWGTLQPLRRGIEHVVQVAVDLAVPGNDEGGSVPM
jgi:hypothetical protein